MRGGGASLLLHLPQGSLHSSAQGQRTSSTCCRTSCSVTASTCWRSLSLSLGTATPQSSTCLGGPLSPSVRDPHPRHPVAYTHELLSGRPKSRSRYGTAGVSQPSWAFFHHQRHSCGWSSPGQGQLGDSSWSCRVLGPGSTNGWGADRKTLGCHRNSSLELFASFRLLA